MIVNTRIPFGLVFFLPPLLLAGWVLLPEGAPGSEKNAAGLEKELWVAGSDAGYVDPASCQPCHDEIFQSYQETGMARAFFRPSPDRMIEDWEGRNVYYHEKSNRYYTLYRRDGRYFQRRHQLGPDGRHTNVVEKEIHFVLGSGNHARSYLHMTADRRLLQLPVAWYSEGGGFWAMNPGYDRPDHLGFRRNVTYECIACHNGYPEIEAGADRFGRESVFPGRIPEGIDCQRCHGPGRDHLEALQKAEVSREEILQSIINPARLSPQRQLELCMQCHLETTSARLPPYLRRYDRGIFSFRPGEALEDYMIHFDHAPGTGREDKFEIVNAVYRLLQSPCFQQSAGELTCLTCHDPHRIPRGQEAVEHYSSVCKSCHESGLQSLLDSGRHPRTEQCVECHMPRRRTDDVIHVVMTDHLIQRHKPQWDLLAPLREEDFYGRQYQGEVVLYYPPGLPAIPENELYLAVAQVKDKANLEEGILRLEKALAVQHPREAAFYCELAEAYLHRGDPNKAVSWYQEAVQQDPQLWPAQHGLGKTWLKLGRYAEAVQALEKAAALHVDRATTFNDLALAHSGAGRTDRAVQILREALQVDPERAETHNNLGAVLLEGKGDLAGAEAAFREAIRLHPSFSGAHLNLARVLARGKDLRQAFYHFEAALRYNPSHARTRYEYGLALSQAAMYPQAVSQLEKVLQLEPTWTSVHLDLGLVLVLDGKIPQGLQHLQKAARSSEEQVRRAAQELIRQIQQELNR